MRFDPSGGHLLSFWMERKKGDKALLEAVLFLSGGPVSAPELKGILDMPEAEDLLDELAAEYAERGGGLLIRKVAGGYQMHTSPEVAEPLRKFTGAPRSQRLSPPALETLAIIAYRQPITKAEVEELRGVNSDGVMKTLLERRLIRIVGKKEAPGRPMLYGTTREFLEHFGINDLTELPTLKDLERGA